MTSQVNGLSEPINSHYRDYLRQLKWKSRIECIRLGHEPCTNDEGNWCLRCGKFGVRK